MTFRAMTRLRVFGGACATAWCLSLTLLTSAVVSLVQPVSMPSGLSVLHFRSVHVELGTLGTHAGLSINSMRMLHCCTSESHIPAIQDSYMHGQICTFQYLLTEIKVVKAPMDKNVEPCMPDCIHTNVFCTLCGPVQGLAGSRRR